MPGSQASSTSLSVCPWTSICFMAPLRKLFDPLPQPPVRGSVDQQVLNPTPLNPTPSTCHKRKQRLHCNLWKAVLQKLHCSIRFFPARMLFLPRAALSQTKNQCSIAKAALQESGAFLPRSCGFHAPAFRLPRCVLLSRETPYGHASATTPILFVKYPNVCNIGSE